MEERPVPEGDKRAAPEEHFVWLSKDYMPYENDLGLPFVTPDFTLGLPPVKDWPRQAGEAPWVLDTNGRPKPVRNVPVDSTSSMDEGKKKKKRKKKHRHSKKRESPELKVTTRVKEPIPRSGLVLGPKIPAQARILNPTVVWAPILPFSPMGIPTPNPGGVL